jgi:nitrate/TMAO reductase-like tetraheme cytochrome c subunit
VASGTAATLLAGVYAGPRVAVTVDAQVVDAKSKASKRFLGVTETAVNAGETSRVTVTLKPVDDIEAFCLGCHPFARDPKVKVQPGQIPRDIHVSGKALDERYQKQVRAYNDTIARLEKDGKPHNIAIPLEERVVKVGKKEQKQLFYTCESCHTLHQETPSTKHARAPFRTKGDLCVGCHD